MDPLTDQYPELTNYQYASCEPIANIDMDGLEKIGVTTVGGIWNGSYLAGKSAGTGINFFKVGTNVIVNGANLKLGSATPLSNPAPNPLRSLPPPGKVIPFRPNPNPFPIINLLKPAGLLIAGILYANPAGNGSYRPITEFLVDHPFPGHGNDDDNTNPHIVYEFIYAPTDGFTPVLKYGISDEYRNGLERPEKQLEGLVARYGKTVTWRIYTRTKNRSSAKFIEKLLVTQHENIWNMKPRAQYFPNPYSIFDFPNF